MSEQDIARFFDESCCRGGRVRKRFEFGTTKVPSTRLLRRAVAQDGLVGRSVLEVGCGAGSLSRALARDGAKRVLGIDLSPASISSARENAREEGLEDRVEFRIGNAAIEKLEVHDIVVLDKVICCFPNHEVLVDRSMRAARSRYGFVLPASQGLAGGINRAFVRLDNWFRKLRGDGFRAYVHDVAGIDRQLRDGGFGLGFRQRSLTWLVLVYSRLEGT